MATAASSEWLTRKRLIDKLLVSAGSRVTPLRELPLSSLDRCAVEEYPTRSGPADYALVLDGRVVGIVEAKKLSFGHRRNDWTRYPRSLSDSDKQFLLQRATARSRLTGASETLTASGLMQLSSGFADEEKA